MNLDPLIRHSLDTIDAHEHPEEAVSAVRNLAELLGGGFQVRLMQLIPTQSDYAYYGCSNDEEYQQVRQAIIQQLRVKVPFIIHDYLQLTDSQKFADELGHSVNFAALHRPSILPS